MDTNGYYMAEGRKFQIPAGLEIYVADHTFPLTSCIYGLKAHVTADNVGDTFSLLINPDAVIGVLTQPVELGSTSINVSPTVTQNVVSGFYVKVNDEERRVLRVDKENHILTLDSPLDSAYDPGAPIKLRLYIAHNYEMGSFDTIDIGYGGMGGKTLPAGTTVRLEYRNSNQVAKHFCVNFEYAY
jgi:hypothetical protein